MINEELVKRYKSGDISALEELTNQNMKLIRYIANKFYIGCSFITEDDLIQEGWTGFYRAVQTYNPNLINAARFSTWAVYWIRQAIQRHLERRTPEEEISLSEPVGDDLTLEDSIEDIEAERELWDRVERMELRQELEKVMKDNLSLIESEVLKLKHGWNSNTSLSVNEVATVYGIPAEKVKSILEKAKRKIKGSKWGRDKRRELAIKRLALIEYKTERAALYLLNA